MSRVNSKFNSDDRVRLIGAPHLVGTIQCKSFPGDGTVNYWVRPLGPNKVTWCVPEACLEPEVEREQVAPTLSEGMEVKVKTRFGHRGRGRISVITEDRSGGDMASMPAHIIVNLTEVSPPEKQVAPQPTAATLEDRMRALACVLGVPDSFEDENDITDVWAKAMVLAARMRRVK